MRSGRIEPWSKAQHDHPAFERHKKSRQDIHTRIGEQSSRRPTRAARGAPQYRGCGDGSSPSSDDDETEDYRVKPRKRKSTNRGSDVDSLDDEQDTKEEAPLVQHPPQGG